MTDTVETLAEEYFDALLAEDPTWAHMLSEYSYAGQFADGSRAAEDATIAAMRGFAARADAAPVGDLDEQQRITLSVLSANAAARADLLEGRLHELGADPIFGEQTSLPLVVGMLAIPDAEVAEAMLSKLNAIGEYFGDLAQRHREGVASGRTPAEFAVRGTIEQLEAALAVPADEDPLLAAMKLPDDVDDDLRPTLVEVISSSVRPGMTAYRDVLRDEVLPHARPDNKCGLSWLTDGADTYDRTLRYFTTTTLSAKEIHDIGLSQIASLADEYRALGPSVVGTDDLAGIFAAMRSDPQLHFTNGEEIVTAAELAMARAEAVMPAWFEVLPKAPCGVESTITGAKAFYFPPAADGSRGGTFFVNVADASAWGTFELEALAFHEGIPGHHLQLSVSAELEGVPEFRKHVHNAAYAEGWGLYSERLADEMGLYTTDADRMGMLSADSLRACRLVVDTGLHALGWSRQQAVEYMISNSPMTEAIVRPEVDRYIVSPGQATSYMVGRLEIQRIRREAERRQGSSFSVRAFHSAVLDSGSLPLGVLDSVVRTRLP
ncbi:MAG: hypothetical protein JWR35_3580 [Marmoricola sp.]|nr:hypothetical protein [Marmoricola sp.]